METINIKACRICLAVKKPMCTLLNYKDGGNYAEMLTSVAAVKVSEHDGLPGRICLRCANALEKAFFLKTVAEKNDRKLRRLLAKSITPRSTKKIAFNSLTDIKSEISELSVKTEPKWELDLNSKKPVETIDGNDVVIADTVIRKCDPNEKEKKLQIEVAPEVSWNTTVKTHNTENDDDAEFLDDNVFQDDDDDDDYVPPDEGIFKRPKAVTKTLKVVKKDPETMRKVQALKTLKIRRSRTSQGKGTTTITCYPIMKNGQRGPPITLKRPIDATSKPYAVQYGSNGSKTVRVVRQAKPVVKTREKLVCPICGILTYTLGNHMSTHNEKKKYTCPQCPKTFSQKSNMETHLKYHSGIKDHICEICGSGFYNQKSLARHNLIHKGERPFACTLCSKTFIARCDLNRHLRIHSGYKPFKCETCSMSFNAKHQLQNHERMHTGERPYTCQVCNVAFSYKVNLNNHVFKVHGINLKFKSIHTVTEEVLQKEMNLVNEAQTAIVHILPTPTPGAHETVTMSHTMPFNS